MSYLFVVGINILGITLTGFMVSTIDRLHVEMLICSIFFYFAFPSLSADGNEFGPTDRVLAVRGFLRRGDNKFVLSVLAGTHADGSQPKHISECVSLCSNNIFTNSL